MGRRIAVIISNGNFTDPKLPRLPGAARDNQDISRILGDPELGSFEVTSLVDEGFVAVRKAIASACGAVDPEDTLLLYYSGASFLSAYADLFLPVADSEYQLFNATSIEADFILSQLRHSLCRRIVLIIDGCHSGAFFHNNRGIPDGMIALTSCSSTEVSYETEEGGVFTRGIIEGLTAATADKDNDGKVSVDELYEFVRSYVSKNDFKSHPQKWVWNLPEPIFIVNAPKPVFISYAREDLDFAKLLSQELTRHDINAWIDTKKITSGQDWLNRIASTLEEARALLLVMSDSSLDSKWVRRELEFADQKSIPIIPVEYKPCELPSWFELQFGRVQRHPVEKNNMTEGVQSLVDSIRLMRRRKNA